MDSTQQKEEQHFICFAYGSNMLIKKLRSRCTSVAKIGMCKIKKHNLKFHKVSDDKSGKCDCEFTQIETDEVYGVLFRIDKSQETDLDRLEGFGKGYDKKVVDVTTLEEGNGKAVMYFATKKDITIKPYDWYKNQVVQGARENCLPEDYIKKIESFESIPDQNLQRAKRESKHLS